MGNDPTRFDGDWRQALMHKALPYDFMRFVEGFGYVPFLLFRAKGHVVGPFWMDNWRSRSESLFRIRNYRKGFVFHLNKIERIPRRVAILGNDSGDSLADVTDLVDGENVVFGNPECFIAAANGQSADLIFELGSRDDGDDAGMSACALRLDAFDLCVGVRAPENRHVECVR